MSRSKAQWKKQKRHAVTLPSGFECEIELPNLLALIEAGDVPNHLVPLATRTNKQIERGQQLSPEDIKQYADFTRYLITKMVVDPVLEPSEVADIPTEDIDVLIEFATRQRDMDALGHHIGGLHLQQDFRSFRRLAPRAEDGAGLEGEWQGAA